VPADARRSGSEGPLRIGVLASQGGFARHIEMLRRLGAEPVEVRAPEDFDGLDGLVIPGGESTTISKAIARDRLEAPIRALYNAGGAILGTCAGLIVADSEHLGLLDVRARRNAFGRQRQSFEAELAFEGIGSEPIRAVFIRAPWVESAGPGVATLASWDGHPVAVREDNVLACSFHPELTDDSRIHALFMAIATAARERAATKEESTG
jgi:5'-phosphate synthase pdxT subunit